MKLSDWKAVEGLATLLLEANLLVGSHLSEEQKMKLQLDRAVAVERINVPSDLGEVATERIDFEPLEHQFHQAASIHGPLRRSFRRGERHTAFLKTQAKGLQSQDPDALPSLRGLARLRENVDAI
eukprot:TRINITY_DN5403_c1_g1_i3.p2 TRINITY_DN5403_c1_g1~~TRINITY_DN5403_c1_g1_i3.p2  ORF type:complete len:125 (-),score=22.91 TRINITY_DN5403_c1_g1_i3:396-770(-)